MSFHAINIAALKSIFPGFAVSEAAAGEDIELLPAASGVPTAKYRGAYLHSPRDPIREAERLIASYDVSSCVVFFGFGLGYFVEAYADRFQDSSLVVVEPDRSLFFLAIETRDFSELFASGRVSLLLDAEPNALATLLNPYPPSAILVCAPTSLTKHHQAYFRTLQAVVDSFIQRKTINRNTLKRFGKRWIRNLADNLVPLTTGRRLKSLHGCYKGIPALILAAGPSVDNIVSILPELSRRCVIVAVDTSLRICVRVGITPDFLVVVDPQYWNARHLDGCDTSRIRLITESATYPMVLRNRYRVVYFGDSLFPLGAYIERNVGSFGKLGAGGSVATSAWDSARSMGCNPILTAGLDLGYPDKNTHFKGGRFEDFQLNAATRKVTAETGSFLMLNDADPFYTEANDGGQVLTDRRLAVYKWWFENQIRIHPDAYCRTLSHTGVKIEGMDYISPAEVLTYPVLREPNGGVPVSAEPANHASAEPFEEKLITAVRRLGADLNGLMSEASRARELTEKLDLAEGGELEEVLRELGEIDARLIASSSKDVVGFLIQDLAESIVSDTGTEKSLEEVKSDSKMMYQELERSADYHLGLLHRALSRLS